MVTAAVTGLAIGRKAPKTKPARPHYTQAVVDRDWRSGFLPGAGYRRGMGSHAPRYAVSSEHSGLEPTQSGAARCRHSRVCKLVDSGVAAAISGNRLGSCTGDA